MTLSQGYKDLIERLKESTKMEVDFKDGIHYFKDNDSRYYLSINFQTKSKSLEVFFHGFPEESFNGYINFCFSNRIESLRVFHLLTNILNRRKTYGEQ